MQRLRSSSHWKLIALLAVYLGLTIGYNLIVPLVNGDDADETANFTYIHWLSIYDRLPENKEERHAAGIRARDGYPPLYQILASRLAVGFDPGDIGFTKRRGDTDLLLPEATDGHWMPYTIAMRPPYQGPYLLWHLGRLFSAILGAGTVILTYFLMLELFPGRKSEALLAAAILASTPRFVFSTATLGDDPLLALLMVLYLYMMVRVVTRGAVRWYHFALIGGALGLGLATKLSVGLVPISAVIFLSFLAWQQRWRWQQLLWRVAIMTIAALVAYGWWPGFVLWHFNEIETLGPVAGTFNAIVPDVASNIEGADLLNIIQGGQSDVGMRGQDSFLDWVVFFSKAFWEVRLRVTGQFTLLDRAVWISWLIFGFVVVGLTRRWHEFVPAQRTGLGLLFIHILSLLPLMLVRHALNGAVLETAQARHLMMPGAAAVGVLAALGWAYWAKARRWRWLLPILPGILLFWSVGQLYAFYYFFPHPASIGIDAIGRSRIPPPEMAVAQTYFNAFTLSGYSITSDQTSLDVGLFWEANSPAAKDYLIEVELVNNTGQVVSSWIGHPTGGVYPTRTWQRGDKVHDEISLPLLDVPPGNYTVQVFLREAFRTPLQRLAGALFVAPVTISETSAAVPGLKSTTVDTASGPVIIDYQVWPFEFLRFGYPHFRYRGSIPVLWSGPPGTEVQFQLVSPTGAAYEPLTTQGNLQTFVVDPDWPSGRYQLKVLVKEGGTVTGQAGLAPPIIVQNKAREFEKPPMAYPLDANFGNMVRVLGYDLPKRRFQPGEILSIPVHWQSIDVVNKWLRIYNRLYDTDQQLWIVSDHGTPPLFQGSITWTPDQVISFPSEMWLDPQLPNGVYTIHYGVYVDQGDDQRLDLPLILNGQPSEIYYVELGPIKLGGPPESVLAGDQQPDVPRADNLGDVIRLSGYSLVSLPNNELKITLFFESLAQTSQNLTAFVHLRDPEGNLLTQQDQPPGGAIYPTALWDSGELIKSEILLPAPTQPGPYYLALGLYDPQTGQRLMTDNPDNEILLGPLTATDLHRE
jgi:hypothetical protein